LSSLVASLKLRICRLFLDLAHLKNMSSKVSRVVHNVFFAFKDGTTEEHINNLSQALISLKNAISGIQSFSFGPNSSPEGLQQGYDYGFNMIFESIAHRDAYLIHPAHVEVVEVYIKPIIKEKQGAMVFDWELAGTNEF